MRLPIQRKNLSSATAPHPTSFEQRQQKKLSASRFTCSSAVHLPKSNTTITRLDSTVLLLAAFALVTTLVGIRPGIRAAHTAAAALKQANRPRSFCTRASVSSLLLVPWTQTRSSSIRSRRPAKDRSAFPRTTVPMTNGINFTIKQRQRVSPPINVKPLYLHTRPSVHPSSACMRSNPFTTVSASPFTAQLHMLPDQVVTVRHCTRASRRSTRIRMAKDGNQAARLHTSPQFHPLPPPACFCPPQPRGA